MERQRFNIYKAYMHVPMTVLRRLHSRAQKRFEDMLRLSEDGGGDATDDEDDGQGEEAEWGEVGAMQGKHRNLRRDYGSSVRLCVSLSVPLAICLVR